MQLLRSFLRPVPLLIAVAVLLLAGAAIVLGPLALSGPKIIRVTPADGVSNANPQVLLRIEFDQPIQPASIASTLRFDPHADFDVQAIDPGMFGARIVQIQPRGGLKYGASYQLTINAARNMLGRTLDAPRTIAFTTAPYVTVANYEPAGATTDVPLRQPIIVTFGAPVVSPAQLAESALDPRLADQLPQPLSLALDGTPGQKIAGVGRWLTPTMFGFYPQEELRAATTYVATVGTEISTDGQVRMERALSWSFATARPLLLGTRPFDGASEVAADGLIEVRLARDVDINSAGMNFSLRPTAGGKSISGSVIPVPGGFQFKPDAPLERGVLYEAELSPGIQTTAGATLNPKALIWTFTTIGDLEVQQVEPLPDVSEVLTTTNRISVRFNHPVVALTTIDAQAGLPQPLQITPALAGAGRWIDTSTYVYSPTTGLAPSTTYTVQVAAGLQDQTGGALRQEYSWRFATITPLVLETLPIAEEQFADPGKPLWIGFNQPMDLGSLQSALRVRNDFTGQDVSGRITQSGSSVTFTPAAPLERGATYVISVSSAARASGGTALASDYFSTFRVSPLPGLERSIPADGEGNVDPGSSLTLVFGAPMDWATVEPGLSIEPKPTEIYTSTYLNELSLYFTLQPETEYRVTVNGAARDIYGVAIGADQTITFRTGPLPPSMMLIGAYRMGVYNAYISVRVPVQHVNVPTLHYAVYRLAPEHVARLESDYQAWQDFVPDPSMIVTRADMPLGGERNRTRIDLLELGDLGAGLYYLEIGDKTTIADRQILVVTPYAITVKRGPDDLFVWAVDLASGQPAQGLQLNVASYDYDASEVLPATSLGTTDAEGILKAPYGAQNGYNAIFLWSQGGVAFTTTNWAEGISPWDFGVQAAYGQAPLAGNLTTERPIYRPGQNVYIRGALRLDNDGRYSIPPKDRPVILQIGDAQGNSVISRTLELSEFGTFNTSIPLQDGAVLGTYSMVARLAEAPGHLTDESDQYQLSIYGSFTVAEYRKPAFEVTVTPARPDVVQGETLEVNAIARYFSGGALANAPVRWRVLAQPLFFSSEAAPGYSFDNVEDAYEWYRGGPTSFFDGGEQVSDGEATTDAQGRFMLSLPADLGKQGRSRIFTVDVEISDIDGQVIASQAQVNVHAGAFYAGLRPEGYVVQTGQSQKVDLITLDPQSQPVGNRALNVNIYQRTWNSVRQQGTDGQFYWTSTFSDTLTETIPATTDAQGRGSITFTPKSGGSYRLEVQAKDDAGHAIIASAFTWVYGGDLFWGINDTNRVDLIADRKSYNPGDTASILVTAPYKGMRALMTIERGTVIEHRLLTIQGTTELLQVPISADYAPNVYVSLVLIKSAGASNSPDDPPVPDLRVGIVNLPVSTAQQELSITITPDKQQVGPRDTINYAIKATDYTGKGVRAELSLALVDKAVLSLADDTNPTLVQSFYQRRPLGVQTSQSLVALVDRVTLKLQPGDKGGGGAEAEEVLVRRNFPDTAYWNPALVTNDDGTANVSVTLPDSLTTWRMTARGLTQDTLVGQSSEEIIATRPLLIRPTLPRFLTAGDKPTIQAVVQNNTAAPIDATVTLDVRAAEVVSTTGQLPVRLTGPSQQTLQVPANGTALVRWPIEVSSDLPAGGAKLAVRLNVQGASQQDIVEQVIPIQRYVTPESVASAGQVLDTTIETVQPSPDKVGQLDLELVPSLAAGVSSGLDYLAAFPYDGSEQSVSKFLPNAVTYRLLKQSGVDDPQLKASLERNLALGLQRLYALRHLDGGWSWWEDDKSNPYITAYVVQGLVEARLAGYQVDPQVFSGGVAYLEQALDGDLLRGNRGGYADARAYVLFVLSEVGRPDRGRMVALFDDRAGLRIYGRAYLLMALNTIGGEDARVKTLIGELMSSAILNTADAHWEEDEHDYWTMSSNARTTALALQALVRADPENFLVPNAVRYLMSLRDSGHWRTTQETSATLIALAEYLGRSGELEADYSYRTQLDGNTLREGAVTRANLQDPIDIVMSLADLKAGSQVMIQRQATSGQTGKGRLYYTMRMRYYEDAATVQPLDQGIAIRREYIAVSTNTLSPTGQIVNSAALGDLVQVRLTLTIPQDVSYLVVEDMLPAGLEALDTSLKTASAAARDPELIEEGSDWPYWWYFSRTEIHDNRVALFATDLAKGTYTYTFLARATTPGAFQTLPATAYQMYAPEVFGRSAGTLFTVTVP